MESSGQAEELKACIELPTASQYTSAVSGTTSKHTLELLNEVLDMEAAL